LKNWRKLLKPYTVDVNNIAQFMNPEVVDNVLSSYNNAGDRNIMRKKIINPNEKELTLSSIDELEEFLEGGYKNILKAFVAIVKNTQPNKNWTLGSCEKILTDSKVKTNFAIPKRYITISNSLRHKDNTKINYDKKEIIFSSNNQLVKLKIKNLTNLKQELVDKVAAFTLAILDKIPKDLVALCSSLVHISYASNETTPKIINKQTEITECNTGGIYESMVDMMAPAVSVCIFPIRMPNKSLPITTKTTEELYKFKYRIGNEHRTHSDGYEFYTVGGRNVHRQKLCITGPMVHEAQLENNEPLNLEEILKEILIAIRLSKELLNKLNYSAEIKINVTLRQIHGKSMILDDLFRHYRKKHNTSWNEITTEDKVSMKLINEKELLKYFAMKILPNFDWDINEDELNKIIERIVLSNILHY
ncbi:MAG: hypothetical protein WCI04_02090, partial [archaeon]